MTSRDYALRELDEKRLPNWNSGVVRTGKPYAPPPDPRDLGLAENIIAGVVKNLLLLQHLTQHYSGRNLKSIDPVVQKILAIGLYQMRFLDRIPPSAAVDEAVEQTRRFGQGRASGFVNAVLRKATRDPSPLLPGRDSPAEYARVVLSHPPELFQKLQALLGTEDALQFCEHDQREAPTIVRLGRDADLSALASDEVGVTPHEQAGMYVIDGAKRAHLADWAGRGVAQVQDPTAALVVSHVGARTGERVLDRCCGLGTKTLQLRDAVGEAGQVTAMDPAQVRCRGLQRLLDERGITNVAVRCAAWLADLTDAPPSDSDRVLVDVPCSNSGVLARRPEARYAQGAAALRSLAKLQDRILNDTAAAVKPGGTLVYSTCSVWPEENRHRVDAFLEQHVEFERMADHSTLPSFDPDPTRYRDGGYWAVLRRK